MSLFYLVVAFALSGVSATLQKVLVECHLFQYRDVYVLSSYLVSLALGFIFLLASKQKATRQDAAVGIVMGLFGSISFIAFVVVLSKATGVVAFPMRSLGNLVLTALISILTWKERPSRSQWVGICLSLTAIWLIY
jgi:drug/metabolite transporter (DMT)-like permease